jgi:hypothetical protein
MVATKAKKSSPQSTSTPAGARTSRPLAGQASELSARDLLAPRSARGASKYASDWLSGFERRAYLPL